MQLASNQTSRQSLTAFGVEAISLLRAGNLAGVANRFGYALAFDRDKEAAIGEDLAECLPEADATGLAADAAESITIKVFPKNESNLVALVECRVPADNGAVVLVELIVSADGRHQFITLEQISASA